MAKSWLAEDEFHVGISGTYATRTAMQLFEEADCVIAVGASMNRYTTEHGYLYPNARFVHLDSKPHVMMSGGRAADCYVQSDARAGVEALESLLAKRSFKQTGYRTGEVRQRLAAQRGDRTEYTIEPGNVDPREVILALDEMLPPKSTCSRAAARPRVSRICCLTRRARSCCPAISSAASARCCRPRWGRSRRPATSRTSW